MFLKSVLFLSVDQSVRTEFTFIPTDRPSHEIESQKARNILPNPRSLKYIQIASVYIKQDLKLKGAVG